MLALAGTALGYLARHLHGHAQTCAATGALLALLAASSILSAGRRWRAGAAGEREVAKALRPLERAGWLIAHDLPKPTGGNLDHLAAGPTGIYTIETKLNRFGKPELAQTRAHAHWVRRSVRSPVVPVLVLANSKARVKNYAGVTVIGAPHLARWLRRGPAAPVDRDAVIEFVARARTRG